MRHLFNYMLYAVPTVIAPGLYVQNGDVFAFIATLASTLVVGFLVLRYLEQEI